MSSGVKVSRQCMEEFDRLKMQKAYSFIIFKMNDSMKEIIVDTCGDKATQGYEDLKQLLLDAEQQKQCRYAVLDLEFEFKGAPKNKLIFISWSPEGANIKNKMVYTSSKDYLKKALQLVLEAQACDADEISLESLVERAQRGMKD